MRRAPQLDSGSRAVTIDGKRSELQEKNWQVLKLLIEHSPEVVPREQIVDHVWRGNSFTGEKGLNQAIWKLRLVLGDNPRKPEFIRTVPRVGYRWIGPCRQPVPGIRWLVAAGMAVTLVMFLALAMFESDKVATRAYRVGLDVHVEFDDGKSGVLINANKANIGQPMLSVDGSDIVVPVYEDNGCRLVIVNLTTRQRRDFAQCPAGADISDGFSQT